MKSLLGVVAAYVLLIASLLVGQRAMPIDESTWPAAYDHHFSKYRKRYFGPFTDWRWFKAQAIVESNLRPGAVSPDGARGVMQIMPATYRDLHRRYRYLDELQGIHWDIATGIYLDRYLYDKWADRVDDTQRWWFTFASYNVGFRGMLDARRAAREYKKDPTKWSQVSEFVPRETRNYVSRIQRLMGVEFRLPPRRESL